MAKDSPRVVLVDDNPLILDLMRQGLEPHAEVRTCRGAAEALLECSKNPPDLVIADYRMPGMDGGLLVQALRSQPQTKAIRVILLATKADVEEKLRTFSDQVEEFIHKPFYVKELASRTKRALEKIYWEKMQTQAPQKGVISGRLAEMNIIDLLQSLELGQKTCALTITRDGESCRMYFSDGLLHHAELSSVVGDEAVYAVVGWTDGSFELDFNAKSDQRTTTRSTQGLLMEALRLLDERNRGSAE